MSEYRGGDPGADTIEEWKIPDARTIHVQVLVDTNELKKWADWHAEHRHPGVAQVLYDASSNLEVQASAIARIRELHPDCSDRCGICHVCHEVYPCRTVRALDGDHA
ncbi:MAG: hypothetical protein ACI38R_22640 [Rhodococcus sp. (in: high G+C Gram-positive bacteria)]